MPLRELDWHNEPEPVEESAIDQLETLLGVTFPADYREFTSRYSGGRPKQTDFEIADPRKSTVAIGAFLKPVPDPDADYSVMQVRDWLEDLPREVVPIVEGAGGDYVCLDYRSAGGPEIVYWHHERAGVDEFTRVAATFSEFLNLLHEPDIEAETEAY